MIETNLYAEDRPINPNQQYLQQKQHEYRQKKQLHDYLKKHQSFDQVLPCFRNNLAHFKQLKSIKKSQKSKAEIYAEIKRKNLEKFGEKEPQIKKSEQKQKIYPQKMTIQYKPAYSVFIDTSQDKLESHKGHKPEKNQKIKKTEVPNNILQGTSEKEKYEKLLQVLYQQKAQLKEEKLNFEKQKQKLQFKKLVAKQQSAPFLNQIKKEIEQKRKLKLNHRDACKTSQKNQQLSGSKKMSKNQPPSPQQGKLNKCKKTPQKLNEIQSKIEQFYQKKVQIEDEVYRNNRPVIKSDDVLETRYSIEKANQIPKFDIESFKDFIDFRTLHPQENQFYKIAIEVFETGLGVKGAKMKMKIWDMDLIKESEKGELDSSDYKRKFKNGMRITKYKNGWIEVWSAGVQRLMGSKQMGYKVIWLRNGDIKQEWKKKKVSSYYCKEKQVVEIQLQNLEPIYYFLLLNQLQQYDSAKRTKTILFRDGRIEVVELDRPEFIGFAA